MFRGVGVFDKSEERPELWLLGGCETVSSLLGAHAVPVMLVLVLVLVLKLKLTSWTGLRWSRRGRVWFYSARARSRHCVVGCAERLLG